MHIQQSSTVNKLLPMTTGFHHRLSVCYSGISETGAARTTTADKQMFHDESRKPIYFEV